MKVTTDIRSTDLIETAYFFTVSSRRKTLLFIIAFVVLWRFIGEFQYLLLINEQSPALAAFKVFGILFSALLTGVAVQLLVAASLAAFLLLQSHGSRGIWGTHTFSLDPEGLRESTAINESLYRWGGIHAVAKTSEHIFIRPNPGHIYILPRRAFKNPQEFSLFWSELESHWKASRATVAVDSGSGQRWHLGMASREDIGVVLAMIYLCTVAGLFIDAGYFHLWGQGDKSVSRLILTAQSLPVTILLHPFRLAYMGLDNCIAVILNTCIVYLAGSRIARLIMRIGHREAA